MNIICRVLGHKPPQYGGAPHYAKSPPARIRTDGIGCGHVDLYGDCDRCGKNFRIISFHPPKEWVEWAAQGDGPEAAARIEALEAALKRLTPTNLADNPSISDDAVIPVDMTMGEIRQAWAALAGGGE